MRFVRVCKIGNFAEICDFPHPVFQILTYLHEIKPVLLYSLIMAAKGLQVVKSAYAVFKYIEVYPAVKKDGVANQRVTILRRVGAKKSSLTPNEYMAGRI